MKTGLVTFHAAHHYGAMLQAAALAKTVASITGGCEVIDYVRPDNVEASAVFQKGLSRSALIKNAHTVLHYKAFRRRWGRFDAFMRDTMRIEGIRYSTINELTAQPPEHDTLLCGSDQIWNPELFIEKRFDPAFFLAFSNARKVAYAPSFGSAKSVNEEELRGYLQTFSHLSVREATGADIIRNAAGRDAPVVLDPTLLLEAGEWGAIAGDCTVKQPCLLCYFVSAPGHLTPLIRSVKSRLGVKAVQLAGTRRRARGADKLVFDAGPREFLALFQNAAFVLTNSFHGAVFSILFERPFICGAGGGEGVASRTGNLLATLGLTGRLIAGGGLPETLETDYAPVNERLRAERDRSLEYLRNALIGE